jgi:RNA polymerase sigma factor (sigma-70 family)
MKGGGSSPAATGTSPSTTSLRALISANQIYEAWQRLHEALEPALRRFVVRRLGRTDKVVDDVCLAVWNTVYRALPGYDGGLTPRTWIFDLANQQMRAAHAGHDGVDSLAAALTGAGALGRRSVDLQQLRHAIELLDEDDRGVLELRYLRRHKQADLAAILETTSSQVEARISSLLLGLRLSSRPIARKGTQRRRQRRGQREHAAVQGEGEC